MTGSKPDPAMANRSDKVTASWFALQACAWVAVLYLGRDLLIPVAMSILLTFLLVPAVGWVERRVRSRVGSVLCVITLASALVVGVLALFGNQAARLSANLPVYRETIVRKVRDIRSGASTVVGGAAEAIQAVGEELDDAPASDETASKPDGADAPQPADPKPPSTLAFLREAAAPFIRPLVTAGVVVVVTGLMLVSREGIRDRVIRLAGLGHIILTTRALEDAGQRVAAYLRAQLAINSVYGAAVGVGLLVIGIPGALVCGLLAGVLRFVPALGVALGAVLPVALSIAVFEGWNHALMVLGLFVALEVVNNAFLEPWIYGAKTGMTSLGVVLCVIFWTWVWGAIGLVMAVPLTVCAIVFARQVPRLEFLPILLGDEPALSEPVRFYQRLLSRDEHEAVELLKRAGGAEPGPGTLDAIAVPALRALRADVRRGGLPDEMAESVARAARELAVGFLSGTAPAAAMHGSAVVACIPAADAVDQSAAEMLAAAIRARGVNATAAGPNLFLGEMLESAERDGATIIVISSVPPAGIVRVRRVCKAVRRRLPAARLVVGSWGAPREGALSPLAPCEPDALVHTLREATDAVVALAVRAAVGERPARAAG